MVDSRLGEVFKVALNLFINGGYSRTKVKDIAKLTGFSVGLIYTLFSGKEAILDFVLKCGIDTDYIESDISLPITEDTLHTQESIIKLFNNSTIEFSKHLRDISSYSFEQMLSDIFDTLYELGIPCIMIENNPNVWIQLEKHYAEYRIKFFNVLNEYVSEFIRLGEVRPLESQIHSVRLIVETLSWWCMHSRYTAYEKSDLSRDAAKAVCLDALVTAYKA